MIARLRVLLPFTISVRAGDALPPHEFDKGDYHVKFFPPYLAALDPSRIPQQTGPGRRERAGPRYSPAAPPPSPSAWVAHRPHVNPATFLRDAARARCRPNH